MQGPHSVPDIQREQGQQQEGVPPAQAADLMCHMLVHWQDG